MAIAQTEDPQGSAATLIFTLCHRSVREPQRVADSTKGTTGAKSTTRTITTKTQVKRAKIKKRLSVCKSDFFLGFIYRILRKI